MRKEIYTKKEFLELTKQGIGYEKLEKDEETGNYIIYINEKEDTISQKLREERQTECFNVINRGKLWYESLTSNQIEELNNWYKKWLDSPKTLNKPEKPSWLDEKEVLKRPSWL